MDNSPVHGTGLFLVRRRLVIEPEQMVENLDARGVPVKYVLSPDEGHGWGKSRIA
jgi:hypothetical protein